MNKKIFVREPYDMHILDEIGEQWAIVTLSDNNQEKTVYRWVLILLMIPKLARTQYLLTKREAGNIMK